MHTQVSDITQRLKTRHASPLSLFAPPRAAPPQPLRHYGYYGTPFASLDPAHLSLPTTRLAPTHSLRSPLPSPPRPATPHLCLLHLRIYVRAHHVRARTDKRQTEQHHPIPQPLPHDLLYLQFPVPVAVHEELQCVVLGVREAPPEDVGEDEGKVRPARLKVKLALRGVYEEECNKSIMCE